MISSVDTDSIHCRTDSCFVVFGKQSLECVEHKCWSKSFGTDSWWTHAFNACERQFSIQCRTDSLFVVFVQLLLLYSIRTDSSLYEYYRSIESVRVYSIRIESIWTTAIALKELAPVNICTINMQIALVKLTSARPTCPSTASLLMTNMWIYILQCDAVCCSVLQCVAVCRSVLLLTTMFLCVRTYLLWRGSFDCQ